MTTDIPQSDTRAVLRVLGELDTAASTAPRDQYTTATGVVFKTKAVPAYLLLDAQRRIPEPTPPKLPNPDKEGMLEENPSDPDYIREYQKYRATLGELGYSLLVVRGTEVVSIPPGVEQVEDTNWSDDVLEFAGIEVPASGRKRYYCWVKYVAVSSMEDFNNLVTRVSELGGVTREAQVAEATDSFRDIPQGNTAQPVPTAEAYGRGDND